MVTIEYNRRYNAVDFIFYCKLCDNSEEGFPVPILRLDRSEWENQGGE